MNNTFIVYYVYMNHSLRKYEVLVLSLSGAIFSGYLSAIKFFSQGCALTVPCPLFLGYPACYYGLVMFAVLAVLAFLWTVGKPVRKWLVGVSAAGTAFALYFTVLEWPALAALFLHFSVLAIPSCVAGLLVYVGVLYLTLTDKGVE